jgi:glutamyl-tRNA reductase
VTFSVIGLSYRTTPFEVRERLVFSKSELGPALEALRGLEGIEECLLLSTCNRTEVYLVTEGEPPVSAVLGMLGGHGGVPPATLEPATYVHREQAVQHLFRVAAGLDSMIVGEAEILGQIRRAFETARETRVTGPFLNHTFQAALACGRRVRRDARVTRAAASVPRAALGLSQQILGSVGGRRVVVVGAGKIATLAARVFGGAGATIAAVANRTLESAHALAARTGAEVIPLRAVGTAALSADIVLACAGASTPMVTREMLASAGVRRRPLLIIDLAIPRGVAPAAASLPGVVLRTLDDLEGLGVGISPADLALAEELIDQAVERLNQRLAARAAAPLIRALRERADAIAARELGRAGGRLRGLDEKQREAVRVVISSAVHKVLHKPTVRLRELAVRKDARVLEVARELFDLPTTPSNGGDPTS